MCLEYTPDRGDVQPSAILVSAETDAEWWRRMMGEESSPEPEPKRQPLTDLVLDYIETTNNFVLFVPHAERGRTDTFMKWGFDLSEPASNDERDVLFTSDPLIARLAKKYATPRALEQLRPLDATPDWTQTNQLLQRLAEVGKAQCSQGEFSISSILVVNGEDKPPLSSHVPNDEHAVENLRKAVTERLEPAVSGFAALNLYYQITLMRPGLSEYQRGTEAQGNGVLCLTLAVDALHGDRFQDHEPWLRDYAQMVIETSPGSFQPIIFLDRPYPNVEAKPVFEAWARTFKSDHTFSTEHLFRLVGTLNFPTAKKIAAGRSPTPFRSRIVYHNETAPGVPLEVLRQAILKKNPDAFTASANDRTAQEHKSSDADSGSSAEFDWNKAAKKKQKPVQFNSIYEFLNGGKYGTRSDAAFALMLYLRKNGYTPQQVFDLMSGDEYVHSMVMQHYVNHPSGLDESLRADVERAFRKDRPQRSTTQTFRSAGEQQQWDRQYQGTAPPAKRTVHLVEDFLPSAVREAGEALLEQKVGIYAYGSRIVMPAALPTDIRSGQANLLQVAPVPLPVMRELMTGAATFLRYTKDGDASPTNCPPDVAAAFMGKPDNGLRVLKGIINSPTLRDDGSILAEPGYDLATGLLYEPSGAVYPAIPDRPTLEDAKLAVNKLKDLVRDYPFADDASRSVWLSLVLTAVQRRTLNTAPLHAVTAPQAGSGKGKAVDAAAIIATGMHCPCFTQGDDLAETEKRLTAFLLQGHVILNMDNCTKPIEGDLINSCLTQSVVYLRPLGKTEMVMVPGTTTLVATGNNVTVKGDTTRRVLTCTIVPLTEEPELRKFAFDPVERAVAERSDLLIAALTLLRAHAVAGYPRPHNDGYVPMASFEEWDRRVRRCLLWVGEADPFETRLATIADDTEKQDLGQLLAAWHDHFGDHQVITGDLPELLSGEVTDTSKALAQALDRACGDRSRSSPGVTIDPRRIGYYLRGHRDRPIGGLYFTSVRNTDAKQARWCVRKTT